MAVGPDVGPARRVIDAAGGVVAPGFVDTHTHLDAQLFWDPGATPSSLHGVTTVLGGNCGFSMAPLDEGAAQYVPRMLARVEGMPLEALQAGVPWDWASFGEWLGRLEGKVAVNAGFFVGHSTLRRLAMGEGATGPPSDAPAAEPTRGQLDGMTALLHAALEDGALGLTTSLAVSHHDGDGNPVPSRRAGRQELLTLAGCLRRRPGTSLGINPGAGPFPPEVLDLMADMSATADRVVNWNALIVHGDRWADALAELAVSDHAAGRGGHVVAQIVPEPRRFFVGFLSGFLLDSVPEWGWLFTLAPRARLAALRDGAVRNRLAAGLRSPALPAMLRHHVDPDRMSIVDPGGADPALRARRLREVADSQGTSALDVLLDVAVESSLGAVFMPEPVGDDDESWRLRGRALADPRTVVGAADAGAHLDVASSFSYTTSLLAGAVRRRGLLTLEEAVRQLTDVPARLFGIERRGRVEPGWYADLVVLDPDSVEPEPESIRADLPGGARRIFAGARGVSYVLVNGQVVCEGGSPTGVLPGTVLRSGRDTTTVTVAGAAASAGVAVSGGAAA